MTDHQEKPTDTMTEPNYRKLLPVMIVLSLPLGGVGALFAPLFHSQLRKVAEREEKTSLIRFGAQLGAAFGIASLLIFFWTISISHGISHGYSLGESISVAIVPAFFFGIAYGCPIGILFGSLFQNERDRAESLGQPGLRPAVNFRPFLPKLITVSMLLGALAGALPYGYGSIAGATAGLIVAVFWYLAMVSRARSMTRPTFRGAGTIYGMLMGLAATVMLHCTVMVVGQLQFSLYLDGLAYAYISIAIMFGLPLGLLSGAIFGAYMGRQFQAEYENAVLQTIRADKEENDE